MIPIMAIPASVGDATSKPMLVDGFGRRHTYLRISVTDRCNLRCVYCMPAEGLDWKPREEILTFEEIERVAGVFVGLGIDKIRLTGGEPTVRKDIETLISRLASLSDAVPVLMTTNGLTLASRAKAYWEAGLRGLNVSLDTLKPDRFLSMTRRDRFDDVWRGIEAALEAGFAPIKLNAVVIRDQNDDELADFVELTRERPIQVRFIEVMPFPGAGWRPESLVPYTQMREALSRRFDLQPVDLGPEAVAKEFTIPGHMGNVGFITSMTEHFCDGCNRIRLTAEGCVKPCLFGSQEVSLREAMRAGASAEELERLIKRAVLMKPRGHAPLSLLPMVENRAMVQIGG